MPRRASYIPRSHDDYIPKLFTPDVRRYSDINGHLTQPGVLERVKDLLLHSQLELRAVAKEAGYATPSALGAAFKRETGLTISQWRASQAGESTKAPTDPL